MASRPSKSGAAGRKTLPKGGIDAAGSSMLSGDDSEFALPETTVIVPTDQVKLTPKEMDEEVTRIMTGNNPQIPSTVVYYNFVEKEFKIMPGAADEHIVPHLHIHGGVLHKESEEGAEQRNWERDFKSRVAEKQRDRIRVAQASGKEIGELDVDDDLQRNQFNYTERAAQTYNSTLKTRVACTEPPETSSASGSMSQWQIYDAYVHEVERVAMVANSEKSAQKQQPSALSATQAALAAGAETATTKVMSGLVAAFSSALDTSDPMHMDEMALSLQLMERLVNQNAEDEVYTDFKYWEDASDAFRDNVGTCLPLWKFEDSRTRKKQVTAIEWNSGYHDLFAVGYGSYDMLRQGGGIVHVYSLKNVGCPEYAFTTDSGVMCLSFHPTQHSLLAVGCYDGSVRIYDVRKKLAPIFASDLKSGKHNDPVWDVKWADRRGGGGDEAAAALAAASSDMLLYTVSSDGQVANWIVTKSELKMETIMSLKLAPSSAPVAALPAPGARAGDAAGAVGLPSSGLPSSAASMPAAAAVSLVGASDAGASSASAASADVSRLAGLAAGCCFAFNPFIENIFLVGTEEGKIHKCSLDYSGQYLATYEGHNMALYTVRWNPFHPRVFISASADWTVRIWDETCMAAVMIFDLGTAVGDVTWAPYSSTIFAAVTDEGKINVYDLHANKHEQLCEQKIVKKAKCTHVAFSSRAPIVLVGDSAGGVTSLKLSPNLRKITPAPSLGSKKGEAAGAPPSREEVEIRKMDRLLALSDAKITFVTPIPGRGKLVDKAGAETGGGGAEAGTSTAPAAVVEGAAE